MTTVVAFTNNRVQVLCGEGTARKISVTSVIDVPFEVNCVINGVITDIEVFAAGIKRVWAEHSLPKSGVVLSLDGNNIKSKKTSIPKVNAQKTSEIIAREFQEIEVVTDPLFGFVTVSEDGATREIIAFGAELEFVEGLIKFFASVGIKVAGITSARCAMIRLLDCLDFTVGKSCIIQAIDAENLTTVLVENGKFLNFSSTRVFSEHGSQSFGAEVARNVSQLLQFQRSERSTNVATEVFMAGFTKEDAEVSRAQIEALSLQVYDFESGARLGLCEAISGTIFLHAGVFALNKQEGNLLNAYVQRKRDTKKKDKLLLKILPLLAVVAAFAIVSSSMVIANVRKAQTLAELKAYLEDPVNIAAEAEYNAKIEEAAQLNAKVRMAQDIQDALDSYPRATAALNTVIAESGSGLVSVNITSYSASTGSLSFVATGKDADKINPFIKALSDTGIFYNVSYSGYSGGVTGDYLVNVSCTLSAEAGR